MFQLWFLYAIQMTQAKKEIRWFASDSYWTSYILQVSQSYHQETKLIQVKNSKIFIYIPLGDSVLVLIIKNSYYL